MEEGPALVDVIRAALEHRAHGIEYALTRALAVRWPDSFVLHTSDGDFDFERFAAAGHAELTPFDGFVAQHAHTWSDRVYDRATIIAGSVRWSGSAPLRFLKVSWPAGACDEEHVFLAAPSREVAERFFETVCRWSDDLRGSVLVFDRGYWGKSKALYDDIANTRVEDLMLPPGRRDQIVGDLQRFLDRRVEYEQLSVPWKRGVLLSGPPGNGKTMCIKVLANVLRVRDERGDRPIDPLYVRSLAVQHYPDHYTIGEVFERARRQAPCLLIFEDLDSLVTDTNRSVFLNELDGLAVNSGLLVIASTNHAGRLDPALRDRPSRFDRTWHFALPEVGERRRYLESWDARVDERLRLSADHHAEIAARTDGFSFAYLKELLVSSTMRWIDEGVGPTSLGALVLDQVGALREQMRAAEHAAPRKRLTSESPSADDDDDDDP